MLELLRHVLIGFWIVSVLEPSTAQEACDFNNLGKFKQYPSSCSSYYQCAPSSNSSGNPYTWQKRQCPPGTLWDQNLLTCNFEDAVDCKPYVPCSPAEYGQRRSIPNQCRTYEMCTNDNGVYYWTEKMCDVDNMQVWNEQTLTCDYPGVNSCVKSCVYVLGYKRKAPGKCDKYLSCYHTGDNYYWEELSCPADEGWNDASKMCDSSIKCFGPGPSDLECSFNEWGRYTAVPDHCDKFAQCAPAGVNKFSWHIMSCAPGTLWNDAIKTCDHAENVVCGYKRIQCSAEDVGKYKPDPTHCDQYYRCTQGSASFYYWNLLTCCSGQLWDDASESCRPAYLVKCVEECSLDELGTYQPFVGQCDKYYMCSKGVGPVYYWDLLSCCPGESWDQASSSCRDLACPYKDPLYCTIDQWGSYKPVPGQCDNFYQCAPATSDTFYWQRMSCPPGTLWDATITSCNHENLVDCGGMQEVCTLDEWGHYKPFPDQCDKYFKCTPFAVNTFFWQIHTCPGGTLWNAASEICDHANNVDCKADFGEPCSIAQWGQRKSYPDTCEKYFQCSPVSSYKFYWKVMLCPDGNLWDEALQLCQPEKDVVCGGSLDEACSSDEWGDYKPFPNDCRRYYFCTAVGVKKFFWQAMTCPRGTLWDTVMKRCDHEGNVNCSDTPGACKYWMEQFKPHPNNCNQYYQCVPSSNGQYSWRLMSCPPTTLWNSGNNICDHPGNVNCAQP